FFRGPLDYGIVRRARETGLVEISIHDLRAFTKDKHRTVDDRPFGGGEGMVLKPEPIFECLESFGDVASREARLGPGAKQSVILDTITRLIPGAVGNQNSTRQESFTESLAGQAELTGDGPSSTCVSGGLLDYPHYTRPADFRGMAVPEVLVNGNHEQIRSWRRKTALAKTLRNRPDLLERVALTAEDKELLAQIKLAETGHAPSLQKINDKN